MSPDFDTLSEEVYRELDHIVSDINPEIFSKHHRGMMPHFKTGLLNVLKRDELRYRKAFSEILKIKNQKPLGEYKIIDIGSLIPILPLILSKAGFNCSIVENFSFYGGELENLKSYILSRGIKVYDFSILQEKFPIEETFDIALFLAVIEHLPFTPKYVLENIKAILKAGGSLIVDTPNVASLGRRAIFLFMGISPLPNYTDFFHSDPPFIGHIREYSKSDLLYALKEVGFMIKEVEMFNFSFTPPRRKVYYFPIYLIWCMSYISSNYRDYILVVAEKG